MLGLRSCARAFSSCGERGPLFIAVRGPLTIVASLVAEHKLQTRRLSSCGSRAQLLRGMWDLPRPGLEPMSPALAGRPSTTAPPGKPQDTDFIFPWKYTDIPSFIALHRCCIFYKWKVCGNPESNKSIGFIFPTEFARLGFLCHILVIFTILQTFSLLYICYGDL